MATSMHLWIREKLSIMQDRTFPSSLPELKKMAAESTRFRNEEIPAKQREKQRLHSAFRDLTVNIMINSTNLNRGLVHI